jgi:transposase
MRPLTVADAEDVILGLQDEIRRSPDSRYDHRLHGVLLVAHGMTCPEVGRMLGDSARTVEYWVSRFEREGLAGLSDGERSGRPSRLSAAQMRRIESALRRSPADFGLSTHIWDGKTLSAFLTQSMGVTIGTRQCQRMFRRLGFRLRKPRPQLAHADPDLQLAHKKTPAARPKQRRGPVGHG